MDTPWNEAAHPWEGLGAEGVHEEAPHEAEQEPQRPQGHYPPRTCRICLEEVPPSYEPLATGIPTVLQPTPRVSYISSDPTLGRLLKPCKCRGSQKYVHEGCLQAWRLADPSMGRRNFWECPTCKFRYRLERMRWSQLITSTASQLAITFSIMFFTIFVFGFFADPIINLYLDPYDTIASLPSDGLPSILHGEASGWAEHLTKGLASLGVLGFVKVMFSMGPLQFLLRGGWGGGGGRRRGGGRERLEGLSWTIVFIGLLTFLMAVWTWVRRWTASTLEMAGERVADVQGGDDDEELEVPRPTEPPPSQNTTVSTEPVDSRCEES